MTFFVNPQNFIILFLMIIYIYRVSKELVADISRTAISVDDYNRRTLLVFHVVAPVMSFTGICIKYRVTFV